MVAYVLLLDYAVYIVQIHVYFVVVGSSRYGGGGDDMQKRKLILSHIAHVIFRLMLSLLLFRVDHIIQEGICV